MARKHVLNTAALTSPDYPTVLNEPSLADWLSHHNASLQWQTYGPKRRGVPSFRVAGYRIGAGVVIVMIYSHQRGWDLYTSSGSTDIDRVLGDAEVRLAGGDL